MKITNREKTVLQKLAEGLTVKEVARVLYVAPSTVETHKKNLYRKFEARTLVQLGAMAVRRGVIASLLIAIVASKAIYAQSIFEIDGTIKVSGLANDSNKSIVADTSGMLILEDHDPAILELKDSTGDVRFRFDANQGLFQMLLRGDTLRELQSVIIPGPPAFRKGELEFNKAKNSNEASAFASQLKATLQAVGDKLNSSLGFNLVRVPRIESDKGMGLEKENGETSFEFVESGTLVQTLDFYSGKFDSRNEILSVEIDHLGQVTEDRLVINFIKGKLAAVKYIDKENFTEQRAFFNENCEMISEEEFGLSRKNTVE